MKKILPLLLLSALSAEESASYDVKSVSEAFGRLIYQNFSCLDVPFDVEQIAQGIKNAAAGVEEVITEEECVSAIHVEQQNNFKARRDTNLQEANAFLDANAKKEGVVCLADGKVQYQQLAQGSGNVVKAHSSPLLRYTFRCKGLNGSEVCQSNIEEPLDLDCAMEGLTVGITGMKEGEKRILHIHPDLGYGEKGLDVFLPNILLTYEVEVLKAN